jgi:hypothetical protein
MRAAREFNAKLFLPKFKIGTHRPPSASYSSKKLHFHKIHARNNRKALLGDPTGKNLAAFLKSQHFFLTDSKLV